MEQLKHIFGDVQFTDNEQVMDKLNKEGVS